MTRTFMNEKGPDLTPPRHAMLITPKGKAYRPNFSTLDELPKTLYWKSPGSNRLEPAKSNMLVSKKLV